jgi:hypothetical protein
MGVYSDAVASFEQAPTWLVVLAITSIAVGAALLLLLGWHVVRRVLDVPRVPRGPGTYTVLVGLCVLCIAGGVTSLAVAAALTDWQAQIGPSPVAEVQCRRVGPTEVQLGYVTIGPDGRRGSAQPPTTAASCEVAVERLAFHARLARLGLIERHRLARVGAVTRPTSTPRWRALPQPMGLPIAAATAQPIAIPSDDGTPYRVVADDTGVRVERLR